MTAGNDFCGDSSSLYVGENPAIDCSSYINDDKLQTFWNANCAGTSTCEINYKDFIEGGGSISKEPRCQDSTNVYQPRFYT
jgi:hypothetical protein